MKETGFSISVNAIRIKSIFFLLHFSILADVKDASFGIELGIFQFLINFKLKKHE